MRITLATGQVIEMSPGHPTADGRTFAELGAGDLLDPQSAILQTALVPYAHDRTYDILPGSSSGVYFAAGAMVGSTLVE